MLLNLNMKAWRFALLLLVLIAPVFAASVGSVYAPERTSMDEPLPKITHQNALVSWKGGEQVLVMESVVENGEYAAWIIPVPGKPNLIEELPEGYFAQLAAKHRIIVISHPGIFTVALICLFLVWACISTVAQFKRDQPWRPWELITASAIPVMACFVLLYLFSHAASNAYPRIEDPEKFKVPQVKEFQVTVIPPEEKDGVSNWLTKAQLYPYNGTYELDKYARKGWHFVAVKLRTSEKVAKTRPIMIRFPSEEPVYPMALTATGGGSVNLDLYTVGPGKALVPGLRVASSRRSWAMRHDDAEPMIFHEDAWTTRLIGRYDLTRRPEDITLKWGEQERESLVAWTPGAKVFGILERMIIGAILSILFLAPILLKSLGFGGSLKWSLAFGSALGLIFSIPVLSEPIVSSNPQLFRGAGGYFSREYEAARNAEDAQSKQEMDKAWHDHLANNEGGRTQSYGIYQSDENRTKITYTDSSGEPYFIKKDWK